MQKNTKTKIAYAVMKISGVMAVFAALLLAVTLFVALGNDTLSEDLTVYTVFMIILCPVCAAASFRTLRKHSKSAVVIFIMASFSAFAVTFAVMIADLVTPECTNDVFVFWGCDPAEPQRIMPVLVQDAIILLALAGAIWAGISIRKPLREARFRGDTRHSSRNMTNAEFAPEEHADTPLPEIVIDDS